MSDVETSYNFQETITVPLDTLLLNGRPPYEAIAQAAGTELYLTRLRQRGSDEFPTASLSAMEKVLESFKAAVRSSSWLIRRACLKDAFGIAFFQTCPCFDRGGRGRAHTRAGGGGVQADD